MWFKSIYLKTLRDFRIAILGWGVGMGLLIYVVLSCRPLAGGNATGAGLTRQPVWHLRLDCRANRGCHPRRLRHLEIRLYYLDHGHLAAHWRAVACCAAKRSAARWMPCSRCRVGAGGSRWRSWQRCGRPCS